MANKTEKTTGKNGGARPGAGRKPFEPTPRESVPVTKKSITSIQVIRLNR